MESARLYAAEIARGREPKAWSTTSRLFLVSLAVCLGGIVSLVDNEIFRSVVLAAGEVALEDSLGAGSITLLGIERSTGHVRNHGVATTPWVLGISERMILWCGLGEPDVTTITVELAGLEGLGNILLDDDGTTGGVDEPGTCVRG